VSSLRAVVEEPVEAVEVGDAPGEEVGWEAFEVVALDDEEGDDADAEDAPGDDARGTALPDRPLTGRDLAAWRASLGLTQQQAADRLGVRQGTVSKAEGRGEKALGPAVGAALAGLTGC
jgi:DNA-binding transcriptional regulator YiaG